MNGFIDAVQGRARTTMTTMVLMVIAGLIAYVTIPKEADPDIPIPIFYVSITHQGISPEDAERLSIADGETVRLRREMERLFRPQSERMSA